ncbi:hypothetical protein CAUPRSCDRAFT_12416 [Caulochytrium protostelioides]|nr:hypothetical protein CAUPRSCDRAFT_12416 [Caulochytrium protostelioides]
MLPLGFSSDSGPDRFDPAQPFTPAQLEAGLPGGDMPQGMVGPADGLTTDGLPADSTAFFAGAHPGFSGAMGAFEGSAAGPGYPGGGAMGAAMAAHPHAFMFNDLVPGAEMHGLPAHLMNPMSGAAHLQGYAPTGYEMDPRQQGYAQQFASPQQHAVTPQEYAHMVYYDDAKLLQSPYLMSDNGNAAVAAAAVAAAAAAASAVGHEESLPAAASAAEPHLSLAV